MKNNLISVFLLLGIVSFVGCGTLKKVGGYFTNVGEAVLDPILPDKPDPPSKKDKPEPFKPTETQIETGKSIVGWLVLMLAVFGATYLFRMWYLYKSKDKEEE